MCMYISTYILISHMYMKCDKNSQRDMNLKQRKKSYMGGFERELINYVIIVYSQKEKKNWKIKTFHQLIQ